MDNQYFNPIPPRIQNLIEKVYGRLTVIGYNDKIGRNHYWYCQCVCGAIKSVRQDHIVSGRIVSCGCYAREKNTKHGFAGSKVYKVWVHMKDRCFNKNCSEYENYGARGIDIYPEWIDSFESFHEYIGDPPTTRHTIERINNNGSYIPGNIKWATYGEQNRNHRRNVILEYDGRKMILEDWARYLGLERHVLESRLKRGWSIERVLTTPFNETKSHRKR